MMPKGLPASASLLCVFLVSGFAEAGIYGRMDGALTYTDPDDGAGVWEVTRDAMRWGITGSEDLGNGMKAIYRYEWAMSNSGTTGSTSNNERTRLAYVGLDGGWGKLTIGREWFPGSRYVVGFLDWSDQNNPPLELDWKRSGDMVRYDVPRLGGLDLAGAAVISNESEAAQEDGVDRWELTGRYQRGPLTLAAVYHRNQLGSATDSNDTEVWGISGGFRREGLRLAGVYSDTRDNVSGDRRNWSLGLEGTFDSNVIWIRYSDEKRDAGLDTDFWVLGARHFMSKSTRVFAEVSRLQEKATAVNLRGNKFTTGIRTDWKL